MMELMSGRDSSIAAIRSASAILCAAAVEFLAKITFNDSLFAISMLRIKHKSVFLSFIIFPLLCFAKQTQPLTKSVCSCRKDGNRICCARGESKNFVRTEKQRRISNVGQFEAVTTLKRHALSNIWFQLNCICQSSFPCTIIDNCQRSLLIAGTAFGDVGKRACLNFVC